MFFPHLWCKILDSISLSTKGNNIRLWVKLIYSSTYSVYFSNFLNENTFCKSFSFVTFYLSFVFLSFSFVFCFLFFIYPTKHSICSLTLITYRLARRIPYSVYGSLSLQLSLSLSMSLCLIVCIFVSHFLFCFAKLTFQVGLLCMLCGSLRYINI